MLRTMDTDIFEHKARNKSLFLAVVAAIISLLVCGLPISLIIYYGRNIDRMRMEMIANAKSTGIRDIVAKMVYKAAIMSSQIVEYDGKVISFDKVASLLVDDPVILNVLVAPDGVVSHVYPLAGNESLIGYNLLGPGAGNKEAMRSMERGQLVFGGPFEPMQGGGLVLAGRLPVYVDDGARFWGLVSVTLRYSTALAEFGLDEFGRLGLDYELWRIDPDTGERQSIAGGGGKAWGEGGFLEKRIALFNSEWFLRVRSAGGWYTKAVNWAVICLAIFVSILIGFIVHRNTLLTHVTVRLERMLRTDPLTGILNRNGLFGELGRMMECGLRFRLWYMDLNYFKHINDFYGHDVGDLALVKFSRRITARLEKRHVFARISGDEFIILSREEPGRDMEESDRLFWEVVDEDAARPVHGANGAEIYVTCSRGSAAFPGDAATADELLSLADRDMYKAKNDRYRKEKRRRRSDPPPWVDIPADAVDTAVEAALTESVDSPYNEAVALIRSRTRIMQRNSNGHGKNTGDPQTRLRCPPPVRQDHLPL